MPLISVLSDISGIRSLLPLRLKVRTPPPHGSRSPGHVRVCARALTSARAHARKNRNQPSFPQVKAASESTSPPSPSKTSRPSSAPSPRHCQAPFLACASLQVSKLCQARPETPRLHSAPRLCQAQLPASAKLACARGYTHIEII